MISKFMYFVGLPCCGKSTFISNNYPNAGHLCDMLTTLLSNNPFDDYSFEEINEVLENNLIDNSTWIISADEIKPMLEGYTDEHPEVVHEDSVQLARRMIFEIAKSKNLNVNIILDGGGINNHYNLSIIDYLREHNVDKITCVFFDTPVEVCIKRLQGRTRKVPVEDIYKKNLRIEACKNKYIPLVDEFIRVDYFTNKYLLLDMDGTLACYGKAKLDIHGNSDFVSSELFKNLKPVKHVIDFVKEHYDMNNVYIVTACANSIVWKEKNEWLDKYFPEIPVENRMFVGNKNFKHVFIEQFAHKMKWDLKDVCLIDDFHDTLRKCNEIGINAVHPSNIDSMFDKYSYQA